MLNTLLTLPLAPPLLLLLLVPPTNAAPASPAVAAPAASIKALRLNELEAKSGSSCAGIDCPSCCRFKPVLKHVPLGPNNSSSSEGSRSVLRVSLASAVMPRFPASVSCKLQLAGQLAGPSSELNRRSDLLLCSAAALLSSSSCCRREADSMRSHTQRSLRFAGRLASAAASASLALASLLQLQHLLLLVAAHPGLLLR
jgi:hypothetical protein